MVLDGIPPAVVPFPLGTAVRITRYRYIVAFVFCFNSNRTGSLFWYM